VVVLGFEAADPTGYGRVLREGERVVAIREDRDASAAERAVGLCNAGLMALSGAHALALLDAIGNHNAKGEYYLTDAVEVVPVSENFAGLPVEQSSSTVSNSLFTFTASA